MPRPKVIPASFEGVTTQLILSLRNAAQRPSIFGFTPMKHQEPFFKSKAKGRAVFGGNRSGKTTCGGAETVHWLRGEHPYRDVPSPPVRMRGVAADWPHGILQIMLPELAKWIPPSLLINGSWEDSFSKTNKILTLANGSTMDFPTHEMDLIKHAGTSRHGIWFDEEPPKSIFNENMARLIDTAGSWWLTETPIEGMTWVFEDIYEKKDPDIFVMTLDMRDNSYLSLPEIQALMSIMPDDEKKARTEGRFIMMGGLIYKNFSDANIIDPLPVGEKFRDLAKHSTVFRMMDHGFNNPTAWLWALVNGDGRVIIFDEHYQSQMLVRDHAKLVKERDLQWGIESVYSVGDPSIANKDPITGTSVQIEYALQGVPILPGHNDVDVGIQVVAQGFADKSIYICRNCEHLIWELKKYRWAYYTSKKVAETKNPRETPHKKDDHACDALRYGILSRPEHVEKIDKPLDNFYGLPASLPSDGSQVDHPSQELEGYRYYDEYLGSEF